MLLVCKSIFNRVEFLFQCLVHRAGVEFIVFHLSDELLKFQLAPLQEKLHGQWIRFHEIDAVIRICLCNLSDFQSLQTPFDFLPERSLKRNFWTIPLNDWQWSINASAYSPRENQLFFRTDGFFRHICNWLVVSPSTQKHRFQRFSFKKDYFLRITVTFRRIFGIWNNVLYCTLISLLPREVSLSF